MQRREWTLTIPSMPLLSSNDRLHWAVKMRRVKDLRLIGCALARRRGIPPLVRAEIEVIVHPGSRTRRIDPSNYADTAKPVIDGIVDAGVLPDDNAQHLTRVSYVEGVRWPRTGVEIRVRSL